MESTGLAGTVFDYALDLQSATSHGLLSFIRWQREKFGKITMQPLVRHEMDDKVLPCAHGVVTQKNIGEARLLALEGIGHNSPRGV